MFEATRCCCSSQRIEKHWFGQRANTRQNGEKTTLHNQWKLLGEKQFFSVMQRILRTKEFSTFEVQAVRNDHVRTVIGIEVQIVQMFEVQVPLQHTSWVRISRGNGPNARQKVPTEDWPPTSWCRVIIAVSNLRGPRVQETVGNSPVRNEAAPKPKLMFIVFSQRVWKLIPAKYQPKGTVNSSASPSTSRRSYDIQVVMNRAEQYDEIVFWQAWKMLSKFRIGTKTKGLTHSVVLPTNTVWSIVRVNIDWLLIFIRAVQGYRWIGRNTCSTRAVLPTINQPWRMVYWCMLVSSHLWTRKNVLRDSVRSTGKDSMMNQEWYCKISAIAQTTIVFISSTYDELLIQILYFVKVAVTQLFCTTTCWQAHWTKW